VPKKVEQINEYLFIDTYESNKINVGVNDMTVNDSVMCVRCSKSMQPCTRTFERE